jgi:hypothetical protein
MAIRSDYRLTRRTVSQQTGKPLKGFAIDLTLRFSGMPCVVDDKNTEGVAGFEDLQSLQAFLSDEITRNYREHYGRPD